MDPDMRQLGLFRIIAFTRQGSPNPRFGYCYTYPGQILWDNQSSQLRKFLLRCGRSSKLVSAAQSGLVRRRVSHQFRGLSLTWTCSHNVRSDINWETILQRSYIQLLGYKGSFQF